MTTKHTPGPWATEARTGFGGAAVWAENDEVICRMRPSQLVHNDDKRKKDQWVISAEDAANARLIAAAPDLLHAMRLMLREHDALQMAEGSTDDRWAAATLARAVLNKLGD